MEPATISFSTWEMIKLVVSAGLVSAVFTTAANWLREHLRERGMINRDASHLAMLLAFQFEGYAVDAASKAADHQLAIEHEGQAGSLLGRVPEPLPIPVSDSYRLLDKSILSDVLDFPQRAQMAQEAAMFWWNVVGDEEACRTAIGEHTIRMGMRAVEIARKFRHAYKLGIRPLKFGQWDIDEYFAKEMNRLMEEEKRQKETEISM